MLVVLVSMIAAAITFVTDARMSAKFDPLMQLVAHRGNAAEFAENSLPALRSALELGIRHIEFDIQLSADHVPVVIHDDNLSRCAGIDRDVLSMNWEELKQIPLSEAARIPALSEVTALLASHPQAIAFVELKRASLRKFGPELVVQRVYEQLKPVARQVVIISFDLAVLTYVQHAIGLPIGWVLSEYNSLSAIKAEATLPNYLFCNQDKLPQDNSRLWRGPWQWAIYEVTTQQQAATLLKRGAHLLETMQVRRLLHELA
jgi:glycerophosphoryl diester phosphodiesterase